MPVAVTCPSCDHQFRVHEASAGGAGTCPECGKPCPLTGPVVSPFDVFISYASADRAMADAACGVLEGRGIRCWIAPRDLTPGQDWTAGIMGGLDACRVMVLVFSFRANQSPQVLREVERAVNRGMPVIPVRIEDVKPVGGMEYLVSVAHWLDAFVPPLDDRLAELAATVITLLRGGAPVPSPLATGVGPKVKRAVRAMLARDNRVRVLAGLGTFLLLAAGIFVLAGWTLKDPKADAEVIEAKAQAEQLWAQVLAADRGQGFGAKADSIGVAIRSAQTTFDQKKFAEALAGFRQAAMSADDLLALDGRRQRAATARRAAEQARAAAEEAKAQDQPAWPPAVSAADRAEQQFQAAEFIVAGEHWDVATHAFRRAVEEQRLAVDRAAFERELARYNLSALEPLTPDLWAPVWARRAAATAAAARGELPTAGDEYREALRLARIASLPYRKYAAFWLGIYARFKYFEQALLLNGFFATWTVEKEPFFGWFYRHVDSEARRALGLSPEIYTRLDVVIPKRDTNKFEDLNRYILDSLPKLIKAAHPEVEVAESFRTGNNIGVMRFYLRFAQHEPANEIQPFEGAALTLSNAPSTARHAGFPDLPVARLERLLASVQRRARPRYDGWSYDASSSEKTFLLTVKFPIWTRLFDEFFDPLMDMKTGVPYLAGPPASPPPPGLGKWAVNSGGTYRAAQNAPATVVAIDLSLSAVNDENLVGLTPNDRLQTLVLDTTQITNADLKHLAQFKGLRTLGLRDVAVHDFGLRTLPALPDLKNLDLASSRVGDAGLAELPKFPRLEQLRLNWNTSVTDAGLSALAPLTELRDLDLQHTNVKLADPAALRLPPRIEVLHLDACPLKAADLSALARLANLRELDLRGSGLTDAQLAPLGQLAGLRRLELGGNPITDAGLAHLGPLAKLEVLGLRGNRVTIAGIAAICRTAPLTELNLRQTAVTDEVAGALVGAGKLRVLLLGNTKVGDGLASKLAGLAELRELDLSRTELTDAGLAALAGLPNLASINVRGTKVTKDAVKKIQTQRPRLKVFSGA